jgi:hypothetical protein
MVLIFFLAIAAPLFIAAYGIRTSMVRQRVRRLWRMTLWLLLLCGAVTGYVVSLRAEIAISTTYRMVGFPLPIGFFHFENGGWCAYEVLGIPVVLHVVGNVLIWSLVFALPLSLLFGFFRPRRQPTGKCRNCGYDLTGNLSGRCPECGLEVPATEQNPTSDAEAPSRLH